MMAEPVRRVRVADRDPITLPAPTDAHLPVLSNSLGSAHSQPASGRLNPWKHQNVASTGTA